jgi:signal peptidase I
MERTGEIDPVGAAGTGRRRTIAAALAGWARDLTVSVVIASVVILFIYQPVKVEGTSMMPSLADQERIFINKFTYRLGWDGVDRGDLVVFRAPGDSSVSFIKRVIGLPGDTVEVRGGTVWLNGEPLEEPYVPEAYRDRRSSVPVTVGEDSYYVLGDHRSSSSDSRTWGPVPRSQVFGKAVFVYWPLDRIGLLP